MLNKNNKLQKNEEYTLKGSCFWGVLLFAILILIDMLTKLAADVYFNAEGAPERIEIIPGWLGLCIAYNPGISYGLGASAPMPVKLLVVVGTAILMLAFAIAYFKIDKRRSLLRLALVFVVAGGVGNLVDRVYYRVWEESAVLLDRGVRDMVDLSRFGFAVCNFADFFISGGAVMLVLAMVFFDRDAIFPMTKKYKLLAKEYEQTHENKKKNKEEVTETKEKISPSQDEEQDNG